MTRSQLLYFVLLVFAIDVSVERSKEHKSARALRLVYIKAIEKHFVPALCVSYVPIHAAGIVQGRWQMTCVAARG